MNSRNSVFIILTQSYADEFMK